MEINAGLLSRSEHTLRTGYDAEVIDNENAQDNQRARELGLSYNTDTSAELPDPTDDDEEQKR